MTTKFTSHDSIKLTLTELIITALTTLCESTNSQPLWANADIFKLLEQPPQADLGDYAMPCFRLAAQLKMAPPVFAKTLSERLTPKEKGLIEKIAVVGGFLNFFVSKSIMLEKLESLISKQEYFGLVKATKTKDSLSRCMIEFSQPNTHKEFHVGHVRNVCLGDSLCRIYRYSGFEVVAANYIGDEGTHVAKCLWAITKSGEALPKTQIAEWCGKKYVEGHLKISAAKDDELEKTKAELGVILAELENKKGPYFEMWQLTRKECLDEFERIYAWMDVHFDHYFYESEVSEESQNIVNEYLAKSLFKEDQGAIGVDLSKYKLGFMMVRKSDGSSLYITKDLALARRKFEDFNIEKSIYVVASEQNFHFQQLFKTLELMGFKQAPLCYHLSYAVVKRADGKMSSREGNVFTLKSLRELLESKLNEVLNKQTQIDNREVILQQLCLAAIKYGMLSTDPGKEIVFEPADWASFEGNSGPYLVYAYARAQSILAKAKDQGLKTDSKLIGLLVEPAEKDLIRSLYDFNSAVLLACQLNKPSVVANHLFQMAKQFHHFYAVCPILKNDAKEMISARLVLVDIFQIVLKKGLDLLGIDPPNRM